MESDPWERLSIFESQDLVSNQYLQFHGSAIARRKAPEITSCLAQGRQFFSAARAAEELAQPLLLYYGVLTLTRGLILFLDQSKRLNSLTHSHGVQEEGWSNSLLAYGSGGPGRIPELNIRITGSGTFGELTSVNSNRERWRIFRGVDGPVELLGTSAGSFSVENVSVSVRQVFERIPDLKSLGERCLLSSSQCHPAFVLVSDDKRATTVEAMLPGGEVLHGRPIKRMLGLRNSVGTRVQAMSSHGMKFFGRHGQLPEDLRIRTVEISHSDLSELEPHLKAVKNDRSGQIFLVADLPNGLVLSTMSLLFLASFLMGTMVRYYPSVWQAMVGREAGDAIYPLLRAAIGYIRDEYPRLVANELEDIHSPYPRVF